MSLRFYRVNISSTSLLSGTTLDGLYPASIPDTLDTSKEWQVGIESFVVSSAAPTAPFIVELPFVVGRDSYGTVAGGASTAIACFRAATNIQDMLANSLQSRLNSSTAFTSQQLRVRLSNLDGTLASGLDLNPVWYMTLIVFPVPKCN